MGRRYDALVHSMIPAHVPQRGLAARVLRRFAPLYWEPRLRLLVVKLVARLRTFAAKKPSAPQSRELRLGAAPIFLLPRYMAGSSIFELSDELVATYSDFVADRGESLRPTVHFFDSADFDVMHFLDLTALSSRSEHDPLVILYGPNPGYFPDFQSLRSLLVNFAGPRILILTDAVGPLSMLVLDLLRDFIDVVVGLDARPICRSNRVLIIGPVLGVMSYDLLNRYCLESKKSLKSDVGFFGTKYPERLELFDALRSAGIDCTWFGGSYGQERLSMEDYIAAACSVRIRVVTTRTPFSKRKQLKGHVSEALASGALLMLDDSQLLRGRLDAGVHYEHFNNKEQLLDKLDSYIREPRLATEIGRRGQKLLMKEKHSGSLWGEIGQQSHRLFDGNRNL